MRYICIKVRQLRFLGSVHIADIKWRPRQSWIYILYNFTVLLEMIYPFYILQETKRPIYALRNTPCPQNTNFFFIYININGQNYPQIWIFLYLGGGHLEFVQHGPLVSDVILTSNIHQTFSNQLSTLKTPNFYKRFNIMQKYGFFFIQVAAILNVANMATGGGGGGGGGLKCFHQFFYSSWSKVFVAKAPTFYAEVHFSSTKGPEYTQM